MTVEVKAGRDKPLTLEAGACNLAGKVAYDIREIEKGRVFHVRFAHVADASESYRGYLNLKTNYPEKPVVNIRIIGRFLAQRKTEPGSEVSPASHDSQRD